MIKFFWHKAFLYKNELTCLKIKVHMLVQIMSLTDLLLNSKNEVEKNSWKLKI